jgi:TonB-dependent receptor
MVRHTNNQTHSQKKLFRKSLLALAIAGLTSASGAYAQDNQTEEQKSEEEKAEVIEVKGQRGNLMRAADLKKNAGTFMDAIDATDISALPDASITEALQRVPGVAIERFAARNDPDHFSTEGTGVVIRGLTQTRSEFNGRDSFSANSGRGLSFQDVPPELVGSVQVFKNQMAEMVEGGISGSINLTTRKAFDSPGRLFAFNTEYAYGDLREEGAPQFSFLYSDRFETDAGEFGFLVNYTHAEVKFQSDAIQSGVQWDNRASRDAIDGNRDQSAAWLLGNVTDANGNEVLGADGLPLPQRTVRGIGARSKFDDRERDGGSVSLQWRSPDENTLVTAEYIRSDSSLEWKERVVEYQRGDDAVLIPVEGTDLIFDEHGYMVEGFQTGLAEYRSSDFSGSDPFGRLQNTTQWDGNPDNWVPYGGIIETSSRFRRDENLVQDFSLNIKHQAGDNWFLEFDAQRVEAEAATLDHSVFMGQHAVVYYKDNGDDRADIGFYDPQWTPDADFEGQLPLDSLSNAYFRAGMPHITDNEGESDAFQFDAKYVFDSGIIESIKTGARYSKREQTNRATDYGRAWKALSAHWGNGGPGWLDGDAADLQDIKEYVDVVDFGSLQDGAIIQGAQFIAPSFDLVENYGVAPYSDILIALGNSRHSGNSYGLLSNGVDAEGVGTVDGGNFLREEFNSITETNTAFYVQANYQFEMGDVMIDGNFGIRYAELETETDGYLLFPNYTTEYFENLVPDGEEFEPDEIPALALPAEDRAFGSGAAVPTTFSSTYSKVLPSFNLRAEIQDDMFLRFAVSQAISYPSLGNRRAFLTIGANSIESVRAVELDDAGQPVLDPETGEPNQIIESASVNFYQASGGNPNLQPMESINYDASFEWYFNQGDSLTVSLFYKDLENFFINGERTETFTNEDSGASQPVLIRGAVNGEDGSMQGYEIAYQQFFGMLPEPFDGLGVQANYTRITSEGVPNPDLENGTGLGTVDVELPLEQLSDHTANFVLLYEKNAISARLAYNWRSDFLLTTRDVITRKPVFNEATGQLDGSIFYSVNESIDVGIQAVNLLDETIHTTMLQDGRRLNRSWFNNDRRYSLILRGRF